MDDLKTRVIKFLAGPKPIPGRCWNSAFELFENNNGGEIYWVQKVRVAGVKNAFVSHYYYIPPDSQLNDVALNQADAGFEDYLKLTVKEVREFGRLDHPDKINIKI